MSRASEQPSGWRWGPDRPAAVDAYGRHAYLKKWKEEDGSGGRRVVRDEGATRNLVTQNVRGFTEVSRRKWLSAWRRTLVRNRPMAWLIQETHMSSQEEADWARQEWSRVWGTQSRDGDKPLSYWSIHTAKAGGVAILLTPQEAKVATPWQQSKWTHRVIAVKIGDLVVMNVYAPNDPAGRERFFKGLTDWPVEENLTIVAGDFNSVQSPVLDRLGGQRTGKPESAELERLVRTWRLEDARILEEAADMDAEQPEPTNFFPFWAPEAASRLDRFYVPQTWTAQVQYVAVDEPEAASDHQRVSLHWKDSGDCSTRSGQHTRTDTYGAHGRTHQ
jgi:exonuclease III